MTHKKPLNSSELDAKQMIAILKSKITHVFHKQPDQFITVLTQWSQKDASLTASSEKQSYASRAQKRNR